MTWILIILQTSAQLLPLYNIASAATRAVTLLLGLQLSYNKQSVRVEEDYNQDIICQ